MVVKIDVEGAEPLVIEGMAEALRNKSCRVVYCGIHRDKWYGQSIESYGWTPEEIQTELSAMGFDLTQIEEIADQYVLKCEKTN